MKQQQFYDDVKAHLLTQMAKSDVVNGDEYEDNDCMYTGPNGLRCAIGGLLPTGMDTHDFEGMSVATLGSYPAVVKAFDKYDIDWFNTEDREFMSQMQGLHDLRSPEYWAECFANFADKYHLNA